MWPKLYIHIFWPEVKDFPKSSEEICAEWKINPVEMHYTEDEFKTLTTYRIFASAMRPRISLINPNLRSGRMQTLISTMYREFNAMNPNVPLSK